MSYLATANTTVPPCGKSAPLTTNPYIGVGIIIEKLRGLGSRARARARGLVYKPEAELRTGMSM